MLDTSVLIGVLRGEERLIGQYRHLEQSGVSIFLSSFSVGELYAGFYAQRERHPQHRLGAEHRKFYHLLEKLVHAGRIVPFPPEAGMFYGKLLYFIGKAGIRVPLMDVLIAAAGYVANLTIITTDRGHFAAMQALVPDLHVVFWD